MTIREKIQLLRRKAGWTQEELADRLGISRQALSRWELGTAVPDTVNVVKLARLFAVSTDYLLDDTCHAPTAPEPHGGAARVPENISLTSRTRRLIEEKGYVAGYFLAGGNALSLVVVLFIGCAYLRVLTSLAPLSEFPPQALLFPGFAAAVSIFLLAKILFYLLLARKLKRAAQPPCGSVTPR